LLNDNTRRILLPFDLPLQLVKLPLNLLYICLWLHSLHLPRVKREAVWGLGSGDLQAALFHLGVQHVQLVLGFLDLELELLQLTLSLGLVEVVFAFCEEFLLRYIKELLVSKAEGTLHLRDLTP
jgi:hypothetical protein